MSTPFSLEWDHAGGCVKVILPSASILRFTKHNVHTLPSVCNMLCLMEPSRLRTTLTREEVRYMERMFMDTGGVAIKGLVQAPDDLSLDSLSLGDAATALRSTPNRK